MANYLILIAALSLACISCQAKASPAAQAGPTEREVSFSTHDLTLVGTFETPAGSGKFPALLLLPGSGPTDRDGNSGLGIKTDLLKDIADELAKNGIASYRFDKRAIAHYKDNWPKDLAAINKFFGWRKFVEDAEAALTALRTQPEVDATRVGMLGHSEGALITLQVAADTANKRDAPKALVLLGSTGRPMGPILHEQIANRLMQQGVSDAAGKPFLDYTDAACAALAAGKPLPPDTPQGLKSVFNATTLDIVGAYCRIDPADLARKFPGPVLVMNGQNDTQVSAERDTPRLVAVLKARAKGSVDSQIVPDASHNFKSTKGADNDAFDGPVVDGVLEHIVAFCKNNL